MSTRIRGIKISTTGEIEIREMSKPYAKNIGKHINGPIEIITPQTVASSIFMGEGVCIACDGEALLKNNQEVNIVGSMLSGKTVYGTIMMLQEGILENGDSNFIDFNDDHIGQFLKWIGAKKVEVEPKAKKDRPKCKKEIHENKMKEGKGRRKRKRKRGYGEAIKESLDPRELLDHLSNLSDEELEKILKINVVRGVTFDNYEVDLEYEYVKWVYENYHEED